MINVITYHHIRIISLHNVPYCHIRLMLSYTCHSMTYAYVSYCHKRLMPLHIYHTVTHDKCHHICTKPSCTIMPSYMYHSVTYVNAVTYVPYHHIWWITSNLIDAIIYVSDHHKRLISHMYHNITYDEWPHIRSAITFVLDHLIQLMPHMYHTITYNKCCRICTILSQMINAVTYTIPSHTINAITYVNTITYD